MNIDTVKNTVTLNDFLIEGAHDASKELVSEATSAEKSPSKFSPGGIRATNTSSLMRSRGRSDVTPNRNDESKGCFGSRKQTISELDKDIGARE